MICYDSSEYTYTGWLVMWLYGTESTQTLNGLGIATS